MHKCQILSNIVSRFSLCLIVTQRDMNCSDLILLYYIYFYIYF